jgi:hypothetical protein
MTDSQAKQVPLIDLLDAVPVDVRIGVDDGNDWKAGTTWHPVGRLCHEASAELRRLHQSEREGWRHASELEQERKRLTSICHDYLGELTAMRAAKQMQQKIDDLRGAQRQWVGLSHEEVMDSWDEIRDGDWAPDFYAVIEAKLKEKNT